MCGVTGVHHNIFCAVRFKVKATNAKTKRNADYRAEFACCQHIMGLGLRAASHGLKHDTQVSLIVRRKIQDSDLAYWPSSGVRTVIIFL